MIVKFTPTVVKFTPIGVCSFVGISAGRNVDWLQWLSSTLAGALSWVGVSAEFGTWGGMLISYCH